MKCRLIVYKDGRRIVRRFEDHHDAAPLVSKLKANGVRHRLVANKVLARYKYPPDHDDLSAREQGKLWCPYCRAWSFFRVPKYNPHAVVGSEDWFLNACYRQGLKVCSWCHITEVEFSVRMANRTWAEKSTRRRRKRRVR